MPQDTAVKALHAAITQLEYALAQLDDGLQFLVKVEGGLEIVHRGEDGLPTRPKAVVAELAGADPLLWQAERPEGDVTLGPAYRDESPRCALTGQFLSRNGLVELYYRGRPVDPVAVFPRAPQLTLLQSFATTLNSLATEIWQRVSGGDIFAETDLMLMDLVTRLRRLLSLLAGESEASDEDTSAKAPAEAARETGSTEAVSTEAGSTETGSTEAVSTETGSTEAVSTETGSTEAVSTETGSTEAVSTETTEEP